MRHRLLLLRSSHARDLPYHAAAELAVDARPSILRCAVEIAVGVERHSADRHAAVATGEIVEIHQGAMLAAIGQLENPADIIRATRNTLPVEITLRVYDYATVGL